MRNSRHGFWQNASLHSHDRFVQPVTFVHTCADFRPILFNIIAADRHYMSWSMDDFKKSRVCFTVV